MNRPRGSLRSAARGAALAVVLTLAPIATVEAADSYERETGKPVAQAMEDAEFAITERNFRITGNLHIGKGIRERDGGEFPDYEVILFCNLGYARQMLELDPALVNFCPGRVTVRSTAAGVTVVSAPLLPQNAADPRLKALMAKLNTLIREIVDYAAESWLEEAP